MTEEQVVLVDENDQEIGSMGKQEAHEKGLLHRAFSVFLMNDKGEWLLQQRALSKYHSPGLWTNACCSHPRKGETTIDGAHRRLMEELGIEVAELLKTYHFLYKADVGGGMIEHELDHVYVGLYNGVPNFNKDEVADYIYISLEDLELDIAQNPDKYTEWFKITFNDFKKHINASTNQ